MDKNILNTAYIKVKRYYSYLLFDYKTCKKLYGNKAYYYMKYVTLNKIVKEQLTNAKQQYAEFERLCK